MKKHSIPVFCNYKDCVWYVDLLEPVDVGVSTFGNNQYRGICGRSEVALQYDISETSQRVIRRAVCAVQADKQIKGHLDWSKFPQGGNIPDPPSNEIYH